MRNSSFLKLIFCLSLLFCLSAEGKGRDFRVFGNYVYDRETILNIIGTDLDETLSTAEMQQRLETTGFFSRVRVSEQNGRVNILVTEKHPWFALPYFSRIADRSIYGVAGGITGIAGKHAMLLARAHTGTSSKAASFLYRDEFFMDSLWMMGLTFDYEKSFDDVYKDRLVERRIFNKAANWNLQVGYHLRPDLNIQFDTHIENHHFDLPNAPSKGYQVSHRIFLEFGNFFLNEGISKGYKIKPYIEVTNPLSDYQFYQLGVFGQKSVYLSGDFNWVIRPQAEYGRPLPHYQQFELGGSKLRGFPSQMFRDQGYVSIQNDFLLTSLDVKLLKLRPLAFVDWAYIDRGGRTGVGLGLQAFFKKVAMPALQLYAGYGFHPSGFSFIAAIGPQL